MFRAMTVPIHQLHEHHPQIRAEDWRSPLVARLTNEATYTDGDAVLVDSFRSSDATTAEDKLPLAWSGLQTDYERCLRTYQAPDLTEFAALAIACILVTARRMSRLTSMPKA